MWGAISTSAEAIIWETTSAPESSFAGDLVVEYFLTEQRNLKVRFYQSTEPEIGGGRRNKTGLGLSFRKEFDTFREFLQGLKRQTKKVKKDSS
jgi:hypothetical protein